MPLLQNNISKCTEFKNVQSAEGKFSARIRTCYWWMLTGTIVDIWACKSSRLPLRGTYRTVVFWVVLISLILMVALSAGAMPSLILFGRKWLVASDDLVFPGIFEFVFRFIW